MKYILSILFILFMLCHNIVIASTPTPASTPTHGRIYGKIIYQTNYEQDSTLKMLHIYYRKKTQQLFITCHGSTKGTLFTNMSDKEFIDFVFNNYCQNINYINDITIVCCYPGLHKSFIYNNIPVNFIYNKSVPIYLIYYSNGFNWDISDTNNNLGNTTTQFFF